MITTFRIVGLLSLVVSVYGALFAASAIHQILAAVCFLICMVGFGAAGIAERQDALQRSLERNFGELGEFAKRFKAPSID